MTRSDELHQVHIPGLEINIAYSCNLKCEYCSHLGRFMKGIVPLDDLLLWYHSWNTKIRPHNLRIMGGEPLLHPHLETILYETRNHWKDSRIALVTNGLLLHKIGTPVFTALKEIGADVTISKHFDDPHYNPMLATGIATLQKHEIEPNITQSHWYWRKYYRINEQGCAVPYQSDPANAWKNCHVKNLCITLLDNCLYRCPQLACFSHAVRQGFVSDAWTTVLNYEPLTHFCTQAELVTFVNSGAGEQCSICPEKFEYADMYEKINLFGLPLTQKLFCGDFNYEQA